jgi:glycosyltransferase involved in cell wall biosynthesis
MLAGSAKTLQSVSLIIPIFNEATHLEEFLRTVDAATFSLKKELILINDGSTDDSAAIIRKHRFKSRYIFLNEERNQGKGSAIRRGLAAATGDIIGIQDADFEYDLGDIRTILQLFVDDKCDVVYGSRFSGNTLAPRTLHTFANRWLTRFSNLLSGMPVTDMETCYKFFRKEIIQNIHLTSPRFGFEPEITAKIAKLRLRLREIPISYKPRNVKDGKKITWQDGIAALWHIFYFNTLLHSDMCFDASMPAEFFSKH